MPNNEHAGFYLIFILLNINAMKFHPSKTLIRNVLKQIGYITLIEFLSIDIYEGIVQKKKGHLRRHKILASPQ